MDHPGCFDGVFDAKYAFRVDCVVEEIQVRQALEHTDDTEAINRVLEHGNEIVAIS